ncbi:hypothetical protein HAX54_016339 [Datura stramonium]|uniref:Pectinesterase n=1 Tax=Datura stramonium TaxID=4076 RepID=A0ABS8UKD5_DATST|nr:hypothetical protein [Datura stramonium]
MAVAISQQCKLQLILLRDFSAKRSLIWINNGIYLAGYTTTAIVWNDTANSANGTFYSGSVQVFSTNFIAKNLSFMNVAPMPVPGADCYIQGSIDFIFGNGKSIYENCQLISIASPVAAGVKSINGAVTAHGRATKDENSGFAFVNCTLGGTGRIWLGRAWRPYSTVVFANTFMTDIVSPEGWNDFNDPSRDQTVFYGEYSCSGAGSI